MKTEVVSNEFVDGKRVSTQKVTYNKSDDLFTLANLQKKYERLCTQIAESTDEENKVFLNSEKEEVEAQILAQEELIKGYDTEEV